MRIMKFVGIMALVLSLAACRGQTPAAQDPKQLGPYQSVEGQRVKLTSGDVEVIIVLNDSRAAADFAGMLPLELILVERNAFAKGMTLPRALYTDEATTRSYETGDFGYWSDGPDLAIFYDDIYDQTIVPIIPMGKAESGAEAMRDTSGVMRLELLSEPRPEATPGRPDPSAKGNALRTPAPEAAPPRGEAQNRSPQPTVQSK